MYILFLLYSVIRFFVLLEGENVLAIELYRFKVPFLDFFFIVLFSPRLSVLLIAHFMAWCKCWRNIGLSRKWHKCCCGVSRHAFAGGSCINAPAEHPCVALPNATQKCTRPYFADPGRIVRLWISHVIAEVPHQHPFNRSNGEGQEKSKAPFFLVRLLNLLETKVVTCDGFPPLDVHHLGTLVRRGRDCHLQDRWGL